MVALAPMVAPRRRASGGTRLARNCGARIDDVGEHAARAAEDVVLQRHALVETDVVLDLAVVADP